MNRDELLAMAALGEDSHRQFKADVTNALGVPEIPPVVFEELLVNALIHRDYLVSAPIRLFIFDNRIEIISPGHLPDNLTVEKIRAGNSNIRNPILVSHIAKGILPFRGLASGIQRALEAWPKIELSDDREGCLFTARIFRTAMPGLPPGLGKGAGTTTATRALHLESRLQAWLESRGTGQVTAQVTAQVIIFCEIPRSAREIMAELGLRHWKTFQINYLNPFLEIGLLERTITDKPKSRLQKYRLTETGRGLLAEAAKGDHE
jgi:hypothetical protein